MTNLDKPPSSDQVSINLRQCSVQKEDGGGAKGKLTKEEIVRKIWNTVFIISCSLAIFNDPLFFYIDAIDNENQMCVTYQQRHVNVYNAIRIIVDIFYIIDLVVSCFGAYWEIFPFKNCQSFNKRSVPKLYVLSRIMIALPVVEVIILGNHNSSIPVLTFASFQWTLRVFQIYSQLKERPILGCTTINWLKPILDFIPFILASHLCGAIWYLLALWRQVYCWRQNCKNLGHPESTDFRHCNHTITTEWIKTLEKFCPTRQENPHVFDFGIYLYAIKANVTDSNTGWRMRASQSFWWALRNLSSFGSNLNSGTNVYEIAFCVVISITGMALFLVYLNARVQETLNKSKMSLSDIELRLSKSDISESKRRRIMDILRACLKKDTSNIEFSQAIEAAMDISEGNGQNNVVFLGSSSGIDELEAENLTQPEASGLEENQPAMGNDQETLDDEVVVNNLEIEVRSSGT